MPHLLIAGKLHSSGLALLGGGVTFDYVEEISERSYAPLIDKADALIVRTQPLSAASLEEGLAWADVISVHAPKSGRPLLGPAEFARMKPGVIIVNTARGGIVDEAALALALSEGRVAAAGLDVFDEEPPAGDHPLRAFDQVVLTPHIAGVTQQAAERMAESSVQNVLDFFAGRLNPDLIVNRDF